ncbi:uncharacterized protein KY384_003292 [Bacidia gigantensis]|uniref:uncharacterized protein n=1 Tax=Bacidia gigantensis TaxID=2732470 RepID=UPI001D04543C|nr:uncharacterized protein KY384_003292 [Bacidia gigantensis]KAG8531661.1 hypothetical protein KY384_003292 [Bacidia gigantensis]
MGVITIFDTARIMEDLDSENAVIGILNSSRQNVSGAIRSMSFSPSPWDLLAVVEEQGRVNVIDLRNALQSAQIIHLEPDSSDLKRVDVQDQESTFEQRQLEIERRFLDTHDEALATQNYLSAVMNTADLMEYAADRRRIYRESISNELTHLRSNPHRLTESERRTMEDHSQRRARRNNNNNDPSAPLSIHYNSSNRFLPPTPPWEGTNSSSTNHARQTASIAEYMRLRNSDSSRSSGERLFHPRRRSSVVVSNSNSAANDSTSLAPIGTGSIPLSASPSRLPSSTSVMNDPSFPALDSSWHTISNAMNASNDALSSVRSRIAPSATLRDLDRRSSTDPVDYQSQFQQLQTLHQLASRNEQQRQLNLMNAQRLSILRSHPRTGEEGELPSMSDLLMRVNRQDGVVTMGVGWGLSGREL